jgi:hypothetical protein
MQQLKAFSTTKVMSRVTAIIVVSLLVFVPSLAYASPCCHSGTAMDSATGMQAEHHSHQQMTLDETSHKVSDGTATHDHSHSNPLSDECSCDMGQCFKLTALLKETQNVPDGYVTPISSYMDALISFSDQSILRPPRA